MLDVMITEEVLKKEGEKRWTNILSTKLQVIINKC